MSTPAVGVGLSTCACGKVRYLSKHKAKLAIKHIPRRDGRLHAYRCGDYWHVGHMPKNVTAGKVARSVITSRKKPRTTSRKKASK